MTNDAYDNYTGQHQWLFDEASRAYHGNEPHRVAIFLAALHGVSCFPAHGMRKAANEIGLECECMKGRRKRAECGAPLEACTSPGKLPHLRDWPNAASVDPVAINNWHLRMPLANFSAVTGPKSGLWVLDIDGSRGFDSLARILAEIGPMPLTWQTQSGSGNGAHYWFRLPDGVDIRNSANQIGSGIDVRGYNGQVLLPGSLHKSGNRYRFMEGHAPHEVAMAEAPQALVELALNACKKTRHGDAKSQEPQTPRVPRHPRPSPRQHTNSLLIGDGEGRGGFHRPINGIAVKHLGKYGADADRDALKASLRTAILGAPASNRTPDDIRRYTSDAYLDGAIESARQYILKGGD